MTPEQTACCTAIANRLLDEGWAWDWSTICEKRGTPPKKLFILDAYHADVRGRLVVHSDQLLVAFTELEERIRELQEG